MFDHRDLESIQNQIKRDLTSIYNSDEVLSILKMLFEHLGYSQLDLITNKSKFLDIDQMDFLEKTLKRLLGKEPIQYILGQAHFYGLDLVVDNSVLIPRQETEELVDLVIKENPIPNPAILDIGTGSGCIALVLKKNIPRARIDAIDNSELALTIAMENAENFGLNVHFHQIDVLHEAFLPGDYNIIVSNPPYVQEAEKDHIHENVRNFEPDNAIFVSNDQPLIFYECIIELASRHLLHKGKLYFEINEAFGEEVKILLQEAGFIDVKISKDLNTKDRIASAIWD